MENTPPPMPHYPGCAAKAGGRGWLRKKAEGAALAPPRAVLVGGPPEGLWLRSLLPARAFGPGGPAVVGRSAPGFENGGGASPPGAKRLPPRRRRGLFLVLVRFWSPPSPASGVLSGGQKPPRPALGRFVCSPCGGWCSVVVPPRKGVRRAVGSFVRLRSSGGGQGPPSTPQEMTH